MDKDWEAGVDFRRLIRERIARAQEALRAHGLGAVLVFNFDNIRYVTGTHIGQWCRDKMNRYALCPAKGKPWLFDPAVPAKRLTCPWLEDRLSPPISNMCGALPPSMEVQKTFARQIKETLAGMGCDNEPLGVDLMEMSMLQALQDEGIKVRDGMQALLDAREIKTPDEIDLLKQAAAMVDAAYTDIVRAIRPGRRENELVAVANDSLYRLGSEWVEAVNANSGPRGMPHSHTFADRIIQPGDMVFLDIMHSFNGYRTCYYRTFICGKPNKYQMEAYEKASRWLSDSIDRIKPGASTADVAAAWPAPEAFGLKDEHEAYLLQYGHGIGLSLWERPILSRRFNFDYPTELKEGMVFAVETWCGSADGSGAARIEEEVVVTKNGCEIITNFPSDHLISCGLPGCEVF
jgi:Xaa-Pro dipeptidase